MKKIIISVESTADLPKEELEKAGFPSLPFHVTMGEETYLDGEKSNEEIFAYGNSHSDLAKTSAPNVNEYQTHFKKLRDSGAEVLHFSISEALSGGYKNASTAKGEDEGIEVVNSEEFSLGIAMEAFYAKKLIEEGEENLKVLAEKAREYRHNLDTSLMISDLKFMAKGGRCPSLVAKLLSPLKIRVSVFIKEGRLSLAKTLLLGNMEKCVKNYIDSRLKLYGKDKIDFSFAALGYTSASRNGVEVAVNHLKKWGFEKVLAVPTNATDACHGGPDVIGFTFAFHS